MNKKIYLGNSNYNFKIKSFVGFKTKNKFIFSLYYNLVFLKKALKLIESVIKNRGIVFFIGSGELVKKKINNNCFFFEGDDSLGILSNLRNSLMKQKIPDVVILCTKNLNINLINEANRLGIPSIVLLNSSLKFDNISYPIFTNSDNGFIHFYLNIFYNTVFFSKLTEKKLSKKTINVKKKI